MACIIFSLPKSCFPIFLIIQGKRIKDKTEVGLPKTVYGVNIWLYYHNLLYIQIFIYVRQFLRLCVHSVLKVLEPASN
jgi:hypothetical protein